MAPGFADDGVTVSENATSVVTGLAGMPRVAGWVVIELQADGAASVIATLNHLELGTGPGCPIRAAAVEGVFLTRVGTAPRSGAPRSSP